MQNDHTKRTPMLTSKKSKAAVPTNVANVLPPCRVCGAKASGFHYGLNTCEACKGFFRRSLKRSDTYVCKDVGKCWETANKRRKCAACRFQACLRFGMSKSAIKTGRYTIQKKTLNILAAQSLSSTDKLSDETTLDDEHTDSSKETHGTETDLAPDIDIVESLDMMSEIMTDSGIATRSMGMEVHRVPELGTVKFDESDIASVFESTPSVDSGCEDLQDLMESPNDGTPNFIRQECDMEVPEDLWYDILAGSDKVSTFNMIAGIDIDIDTNSSSNSGTKPSRYDTGTVSDLNEIAVMMRDEGTVMPYDKETETADLMQRQLDSLAELEDIFGASPCHVTEDCSVDNREGETKHKILLKGSHIRPKSETKTTSTASNLKDRAVNNTFSDSEFNDDHTIEVPDINKSLAECTKAFNQLQGIISLAVSMGRRGSNGSTSSDAASRIKELLEQNLTSETSSSEKKGSQVNNMKDVQRGDNDQEYPLGIQLHEATKALVPQAADRKDKENTLSPLRKCVLEISATITFTSPSHDYDALVDFLVKEHLNLIRTNADVSQTYLLREQKHHFEEFKLREEIFGSLDPLSQAEFEEIFSKTGVDIDNRTDMVKFFVPLMDVTTRNYVRFAKLIPGFKELCLEDQACLIEVTHWDFWFLGNFSGYNNDLKIVRLPSGSCFHLKEIAKLWDMGFISKAFKIAEQIQQLLLLKEEYIIVKILAVLLFALDRCKLKDGKRVEAMQTMMTQCLRHMLQKNHLTEVTLMKRIMDVVDELRTLGKWRKVLESRMQMWPFVYQYPLMLEIFRWQSKSVPRKACGPQVYRTELLTRLSKVA